MTLIECGTMLPLIECGTMLPQPIFFLFTAPGLPWHNDVGWGAHTKRNLIQPSECATWWRGRKKRRGWSKQQPRQGVGLVGKKEERRLFLSDMKHRVRKRKEERNMSLGICRALTTYEVLWLGSRRFWTKQGTQQKWIVHVIIMMQCLILLTKCFRRASLCHTVEDEDGVSCNIASFSRILIREKCYYNQNKITFKKGSKLKEETKIKQWLKLI